MSVQTTKSKYLALITDMSIGTLVKDFIGHRMRSNTRHGVHSPFVSALIDECIYASEPQVPASVQAHYRKLKKDTTSIEGLDLGRDEITSRTVSDYAIISSIPDFQAALLHRLVAYLNPEDVLELGTNLGKSLACMASANPNAKFTGVEGNAALARHAKGSLERLNLSHVRVISDAFDDFLANNKEEFDLIFLDGDHRYAPTMRYLEALKERLREGGAIIFHDIYWSEEMKRAWKDIKNDRNITVTLDLFFLGIAWIGKPPAKEHFSIRFPSKLREGLG